MQTWQLTSACLIGPFAVLRKLITLNDHFAPIRLKMWISVSAPTKIIKLVQVLQEHEIIPAAALAVALQLRVSEMQRAPKHHIILESEHWVTQVQLIV